MILADLPEHVGSPPRQLSQHRNDPTVSTKEPLLPPAQSLLKGSNVNTHSPPHRVGSDSDEDIYTLPGPTGTTCTSPPPKMEDVTYYNFPVRDQQPHTVPGSEKLQVSGTTLLVTGSNRVKPVPPPKPIKGKPHTGKCSSAYTMEHTVCWIMSFTLLHTILHTWTYSSRQR